MILFRLIIARFFFAREPFEKERGEPLCLFYITQPKQAFGE